MQFKLDVLALSDHAAPAIEITLVTLLGVHFMSQTSRRRSKPLRAVSGYLPALWAFWLLVMMLRTLLYQLLPLTIAWLANLVIASTALLLLLVFQITTILALRIWGQWLTWPLVRTYLQQVGWLHQVLGVRRVHVGLFVAMVLAVTLLSTGLMLRLEWADRVTWHWTAGLGTLSAFLAGAWYVRQGISSDEPLAFFFSLKHAYAPETAPWIYTQDIPLQEQAKVERQSYQDNPAQARTTNIIVLVVDALREDHLCAYGYVRATSPNLSRLIKDQAGVVIMGMRAAGPNSFVGLLALARSKNAHQFTQHDLSLSEVLHHHGYQRRLLLAGDHTNYYGLKQALGAAEVFQDGTHWPQFYVNDDCLVLAALKALPQATGANYLQLHLMSAHGSGVRLPGTQFFTPTLHPLRAPKLNPARAHPDVVNYYDNGVRRADQIISQALEVLADKGYLNDALVVVTADHGEALGECNVHGHSQDLQESGLRIPCVFLRFGGQALSELKPPPICSQLDIAPTILHELALPIPKSWCGHALQTGQMHAFLPIHNNHLIGCYQISPEGFVHKYWRDFSQSNFEHYACGAMTTDHWVTALEGNQIEHSASPYLAKARAWSEQMHTYKQGASCAF